MAADVQPGGSAGCCTLCGAQAKLELGHLIPRFVYRGLKLPDGPTRPLLCGACEDLFSGYESTFARVVFYPLLADSWVVAKYEKWLLHFAASVCWRILGEHLAANPASQPELGSCQEAWRQFLRGKRPDVTGYPIHLLRANQGTGAGPVAMEVSSSEGESFVSVKLGPVILLGMVTDPDAAQWQGTRIHLEGKLKPRDVFIPARYRNYLLGRGVQSAKA